MRPTKRSSWPYNRFKDERAHCVGNGLSRCDHEYDGNHFFVSEHIGFNKRVSTSIIKMYFSSMATMWIHERQYTVVPMCRADAMHSGYYDWSGTPPRPLNRCPVIYIYRKAGVLMDVMACCLAQQ